MGNSSSMFNKSKKPDEDLLSVISSPLDDKLDSNNKKTEEQLTIEQHHSYLNSMFNLKSIFKKLDPSVLNQMGNVQGEIKVSCKFVDSLLLVKVILAQDLTAKDVRGETADPYVKVELLIDGKLQDAEGRLNTTKVIKNTRNPVYNEIFSFEMKKESLKEAQVRFSVWCYDEATEDDFIGEGFLTTADNINDDGETFTTWLSLKPQIDLNIGGEISVKLVHKLPQNLQITVEFANRLGKITNTTQPYVRIYIPGVPYLHKTKAYKNEKEEEECANPCWNETFEFPILKEELINKHVVLIVSDINDDSAYLGETHINLEDMMLNSQLERKYQLQDLRASVATRSRWAKCVLQEEFQEALAAHASYKTPKFLFSRPIGQAGNQAITVRVPKASASSRLRLVNGILVH